MEKDFHYYFIYTIARLTNCEDADVIAYASQFVDDNNEGKFSIEKKATFFPTSIKSNGSYFYPIMTQSLSPKSLETIIQKYVYLPFHFLPGDNNVEIKGKKNPLSTTPNSKNAKSILKAALKSQNPYQIGIALHTFADTWSHQNFTALREDWNSVYPWYNIFKSIAPNIGHAEVGHSPDIISEIWTDHRFDTPKDRTIVNADRAFAAIGEIYKTLRIYTKSGPWWTDIKKDFKKLVNTFDYNARIHAMADLLTENHLAEMQTYDKDKWIDDALDIKGNEIVIKDNFTDTHWYQFQQAAKDQFAMVTNLIKEI